MHSLLTEIYRFQGFRHSQHDEYEDDGDGDSAETQDGRRRREDEWARASRPQCTAGVGR